jgi:putative copper resistance protein D
MLLLLNLPLQVLLLSAAMTGDESWKLAWSALPDVAATHAGRAEIIGFCVVLFLVAFSFFESAQSKTRWVVAGSVIVLALLASRAFCGHAASDGDFTLREGMQFLHLTSIAVWGGGIVVAGFITVPYLTAVTERDEVVRFGKRLSRTVTIALIVVLLSGFYNAWKGLGGSVSHMPGSPWGRMLMLKVALVLLALGHGARVRLLLGTTGRASLIGQWLRAEAALMIFVFICSAWLANLQPADM